MPVYRAEIVFRQLVGAYLFVHHAQRGGVLRGDDYTAGVAVDAVAERRRERLLARRIVFALAVEVGFDVTNQRVYLLVVVRMYDYTRLLVYKQNIFVLVYDIEVGRKMSERG